MLAGLFYLARHIDSESILFSFSGKAHFATPKQAKTTAASRNIAQFKRSGKEASMFRSLAKWCIQLAHPLRLCNPAKSRRRILTVEALDARELMSVGSVSQWANSVIGFSSQY